MTWNDKAYNDIVAKHSALEGKAESVALSVWALKQNKSMTPQDWRDLSAKTGVRIAGRAVGSARQILGLSSATKRNAKPKGSKMRSGKAGRGAQTIGSLTDLVQSIREVEKERDRAVAALHKIRDLLEAAI